MQWHVPYMFTCAQASETHIHGNGNLLAKITDARTYCAKVAPTKAQLAALAVALATTNAPDPEPHVTTLAAMLKMPVSDMRLVLAVAPVLLAELIGSLGFVIARAATPDAAPKPAKTPLHVRLTSWLGRWWASTRNASGSHPEASQRNPAATTSAPVIAWPGPTR